MKILKINKLCILSSVIIVLLFSACSNNIKSTGLTSIDYYNEKDIYSIKTYYNGKVLLKKDNKIIKIFPDSKIIFNKNNSYTLKNGIMLINKDYKKNKNINNIDINYKIFFKNTNGDAQFIRIMLPENLKFNYSTARITYHLTNNNTKIINTKLFYLFKNKEHIFYGFFIPFNLFWEVKDYEINIEIGDYKSFYINIITGDNVNKKEWDRQTVYFNFKKSSEILKTDYNLFKLEKMERDNVYKIITPSNYFIHGFDYPLLWRQYLTSEYGLIRKWVFYNGKLYSVSVHNGLDFANKRGTVIYASCDGIVRYAKYAQLYGNMVILDHGCSVFSEYYHMDAIAVKSGDIVRKGDIIGFMGSTGASTGSHLHWTVRINELIINPRSLLDINKILTP